MKKYLIAGVVAAGLMLCIGIGAEEGAPRPQIPTRDFTGQPTYEVVKVADGDTVWVMIEGKSTRMRLIGVDTPETMHPEVPVQYYGAEASMFLTNLLLGEEVYIEHEPGMTTDMHDRPLVYLYRAPDGLFVNLEVVRQGYGRVEAPPAFQYVGLFTYYEQLAKEIGKGLWGRGSKAQIHNEETEAQPPGVQPSGDDIIVYVTKAGRKYHREDCSYLSDSKIPIRLKEAKQRGYSPCRRCKPPE